LKDFAIDGLWRRWWLDKLVTITFHSRMFQCYIRWKSRRL